MNTDRFRFRVWDGKKYRTDVGKWCIGQDGYAYEVITLDGKSSNVFFRDSVIIEQSTGLKDKNGKLIFEGDILLITDDFGRKKKGYISFCNYTFIIIWLRCNNMRYIDVDTLRTISCHDIEVIGNIHEMETKNDIR